jgi:hypothetical protein
VSLYGIFCHLTVRHFTAKILGLGIIGKVGKAAEESGVSIHAVLQVRTRTYCVALCYVVWCGVVSCCVMWCGVVLYCIVLCCVVLCHVVLFLFFYSSLNLLLFLLFIFFFSIYQNPILNSENVDFVVTTEDVTLSQVQSFAGKIAAMPFSQNKPLFMPILV